MNPLLTIAISGLLALTGVGLGEEPKIEFSDPVLKALGGQSPLKVEAVRKDNEIWLRLTNTSKAHVVVMKHCLGYEWRYEGKDGTEVESGGGAGYGLPKEFNDHVVLKPPSAQSRKGHPDALSVSSWTIWKTPRVLEGATTCVFDLSVSGYFPTIDEYVTFAVTGRLALEPKDGEQDGADQPATAPESKPEGQEKPKPESEVRPR